MSVTIKQHTWGRVDDHLAVEREFLSDRNWQEGVTRDQRGLARCTHDRTYVQTDKKLKHFFSDNGFQGRR